MIDLEAIKQRIPKYGSGDIKALIEEVERLRGERAAVVAFMRDGTTECRACLDAAVIELAERIERGEHRREEEP